MRNRYYSGQQRSNLKKAIIYFATTIAVVLAFLYVGVPILARLAISLGGDGGKTGFSDTTAPAPPRLAPMSEFLREEFISVKGFTEARADVEIFVNNNPVKKVLADDSGEFLFSDIKIASGSNQIHVISADESGNVSQPSGSLKVILDKLPPQLTMENPKEGDRFTGQDKKVVRVNGQSEEDVQILVNGRLVQVNDEGKFDTNLTLNDGEQEIKIVATDKAGNITEKMIKVTFIP